MLLNKYHDSHKPIIQESTFNIGGHHPKMTIPRDKNPENLHHRGGKGPHHDKRKDMKHLRRKFKEKLRRLIQTDKRDTE